MCQMKGICDELNGVGYKFNHNVQPNVPAIYVYGGDVLAYCWRSSSDVPNMSLVAVDSSAEVSWIRKRDLHKTNNHETSIQVMTFINDQSFQKSQLHQQHKLHDDESVEWL
ncbi:hypothetical protein FF38_11446 [Lucilia cuprina]|uniref:Uncharacterized protein n=1 Tax=Lucilia cuprina TaxID=7375 RepID=A0A0L0CC06_LUCCU|nr:hypothetical protein FF38_11446 [Lucilia cuprina]